MSIFQKATEKPDIHAKGRFEKFNLTENPFPAEPVVNQESEDKRLNGGLYEKQIRKAAYDAFTSSFLLPAHSSPSHLRIGFLLDTSYVGRGNGKSAFLINLQRQINSKYCLDISEGRNKCFALTVSPLPGGRTKSFSAMVDLIFDSMCRSKLIETAIGMLRFMAITELSPAVAKELATLPDQEALALVNDPKYWSESSIPEASFRRFLSELPELQALPGKSPLSLNRSSLFDEFLTAETISRYYDELSHRDGGKSEFVFDELVRLFTAAGFNGGYIFMDDFERVPMFQSARQKKDFALELRSAIYDGLTANARVGFLTLILVLHAGVPRLLSDAWAESGMENRAPMAATAGSAHIIHFEPISQDHAVLLVERYLKEFRIVSEADPLKPFTKEAIKHIGERSEYNAAKILKTCFALLEQASKDDATTTIDEEFVDQTKAAELGPIKPVETIVERESFDLTERVTEE